jgi:hypothetical protein
MADLGIGGRAGAPVDGEAGAVGSTAVSGVAEGVGVRAAGGVVGAAGTVGVPAGSGLGAVGGWVPNA